MPRKARMYIPGVPAHIVQRGNNRNACFFEEQDYVYYLEVLAEGLRRFGADLHAYCLMTNHVHLLITPHYKDSISRVIQHMGRQYVQYINKAYRRTGTLWEGRHKGSLVDTEHYLLACYRYIELNPVAAGMVTSPEMYPWSSYHHNGADSADPLITEHPVYQSLAETGCDRRYAYRELHRAYIDTVDIDEIQQCLAANQVLGSSSFRREIEVALGIKLHSGRGRPLVKRKSI